MVYPPGSCVFPECKNKRRSDSIEHCVPHRRMLLRGEELRPLRPRSPLTELVCTGPECDRPTESRNLCKQHASQWRRYRELTPLKGPNSRYSRRGRNWWASLTEEQRAAKIAELQAGMPRTRTLEHSRKLSEAHRKLWEQKRAATAVGPRKCRTCKQVYQPPDRRFYYCSPNCRKIYSVITKHGLTFAGYNALLDSQGGVCALCKGAWRGWGQGRGPHIDHCHKTGKVRGILCGDCNTAIGRFNDDPVLLRRAAAYLEAAM